MAGNSLSNHGAYQGLSVGSGISHFSVHGGRYRQIEDFGNYQAEGIVIQNGGSDYYDISGADVTGNMTAGLLDGGSGRHARVHDNIGFNPVGVSTISVTASPFTYTIGHQDASIAISNSAGSAVSAVTVDGVTFCTAAPCQFAAHANDVIVVTYSGSPAPTMAVNKN